MSPLPAAFDEAFIRFGVTGVSRPLVERALGFRRLVPIYQALAAAVSAESITARLLRSLSISYRIAESDLERIPAAGPVVIVANHPFGIAEGAVLMSILSGIRQDVRFLANELLAGIPELRDLLIPVHLEPGASSIRENAAGLRHALELLRRGGCLVVFPAGEVSHFQLGDRAVSDPPWHTAVTRMISAVARKGTPVTAVPVFIPGSNSLLFQTLGVLSPKLRTALLVRELLNKRNKTIEVRAGSPIASRRLLEIGDDRAQTDYLRWRTYLLAKREQYKPRTSRPLRRSSNDRRAPIVDVVDPAVVARDIAALGPEHQLARVGDLDVYIAPAGKIPSVLREIGRLRELTFRAAGEGTGKAIDLDRFDADYLHLFAWDAGKEKIVGAYRLGATDRAPDLYTRTLFRYDQRFVAQIGPALELGRSFIREEYQKSFAGLLALWKGIGGWIAQNPQYKVLFGPVSISNRYQSVSRELMVAWLEKRAPLREWTRLVSSRTPLRGSNVELPGAQLDLDDVSDAVADIQLDGAGVPVLLRQYLKLGGKLLAFNVDANFSNAVDGLILVDLTKTEPRLLYRYFGKHAAGKFLGYWDAREANHGDV